MLTFNETDHQYFWQGKPVANVTRILGDLTSYAMVDPDKLEIARQKGVAVHKMVELWASDSLDLSALPEWMLPVWDKWLEFVAHTRFEVIRSEYRVFHPSFQYAGTLDLFGKINGDVAFIDIKRSFLAGPVIGLQLAAYLEAYCAQEKEGKGAKRYALKLNENTPLRLEEFSNKNDFNVFTACLIRHKWKEQYK